MVGCRWYVARALPGYEFIAQEVLKNRGFRCEVPSTKLDRPMFGRRCKPVFAGYVFIYMDLACPPDAATMGWQGINGARGIVRLLPVHKETPDPLPDGFFEDILELGAVGAYDEITPEKFVSLLKKDDLVTIGTGPFAQFVGKFKRQDRGSVVLLLTLLGRQIDVSIPKTFISLERPALIAGSGSF